MGRSGAGGVYCACALAILNWRAEGGEGCLTTVDGSLGGGLLALVLSTLVTLAELDLETASLDFWQSAGISTAIMLGHIRY